MEQILDKTCNNSTFQANFVMNCLAGKDEENKMIYAEEIGKHGKSPWRVCKYKWERKHTLFQNILEFCIFFPKLVLPFLPFFNVFLLFLWKIMHMPLLSRICPDSHGELGKKSDTNFSLTFAFAKVKVRWYYNGIKDATMQIFL